MKTVIQYEVTDTYAGEANYSWVKRDTIDTKEGEDFTDLAAIRRVKKAIGWNGCRTKTENIGDTIALYPVGVAQVCFITFHTYGNASSKS